MASRTEDRERVQKWMGQRSQRAAAKVLGCSQTFLSMWLRHQRELGREQDERWAGVTGIPLRVFRMPKDLLDDAA